MVKEIIINALIPHPENCNYMDAETLKKLRRHIERTGKYEPLIVRPHPWEEGKFQVINGRNRLRILRAIGHKVAKCIVWDIDDDESRLYLATLNRLSGRDVPERRAILLESLLEHFEIDELSLLLPENRKEIEELERLARIELNDLIPFEEPGKDASQAPVILNFLLDASQAKEVNLALDLIINAGKNDLSRSQALARLARFYLRHCKRPLKNAQILEE